MHFNDPTNDPLSAETSVRSGCELTCNHYVAAPIIALADGSIHSLNALHRGLGGLISWAAASEFSVDAEPLLRLRFTVDGALLQPADLRWDRIDRWIPRWRAQLAPELHATCTLCLPGGTDVALRGGVLVVELTNRARDEQTVDVALQGAWRHSLLSIASTRALTGTNRLVRGAVHDGIALELGSSGASAALALAGDSEAAYRASGGHGSVEPIERGAELGADNGELLRFEVRRAARIRSGKTTTVAFYIGAAPERDGALATAYRLAHIGSEEILRLARLDLTRLARRTRDGSLAAVLNRNLLFACYAGIGRALDDDRLFFLRSRSPAHGPCAVFNEREALLWLLPALTAADPYLGREALMRAFEQYSHRPGERWRYLDGGVLAPGFALDQFCAYALALDRFATEAKEAGVLDEPLVQDVLRELDESLFHRLDPEYFLCSTELLPSGEPADHPFVAFDNALVWRFAESLSRIHRRRQGEPAPRFDQGGEEVAAALWHRCTVEVEGMRVLGYSSDLRGGIAIYDDPAGSLRLLPYIGFCETDDPIWANTMELLHSRTYPLWHGARPFPGFAGRSQPERASFAALCSDLLTPRRDDALQLLRRLDLEAGIAGETYDPDTGRVASGAFSAPLAGFVAWAILYERPTAPEPRPARKRKA